MTGLLGELLSSGKLVERVKRVLRFDASVYTEIEEDPGAIPQAFAVVIVTSVIVGLGQGSFAGVFAGMAGSLAFWLAGAGLIWAVGALTSDDGVEYAYLLRGLGFAYAWFALTFFDFLWLIGGLVGWVATAAAFWSTVLATRQALRVETARALGVCAIAVVLPLLLGFCIA